MTWTSPRTLTPCLETYTGNYVSYLNPTPNEIDVYDIARGLANTCRFAGQTSRYYSVAEHAIRVRQMVIDAGHPEFGFAALHHDSHEAYLGDWPSPLKKAIGQHVFDRLARKFDVAICEAFRVPQWQLTSDVVRRADYEALMTEAATLKKSQGVGEHWGNDTPYEPDPRLGMNREWAETMFIAAHYEETRNR